MLGMDSSSDMEPSASANPSSHGLLEGAGLQGSAPGSGVLVGLKS